MDVFESNRPAGWSWARYSGRLLTEPRAYRGFDFIVEKSKLKAILRDLTAAFGELGSQDSSALRSAHRDRRRV